MRAVAVTEPNTVEVVDLPDPRPGPYEVRVKTEVACLCNATDGKLVAGHFPGVEKARVQWIRGQRQGATVLEPDKRLLRFD